VGQREASDARSWKALAKNNTNGSLVADRLIILMKRKGVPPSEVCRRISLNRQALWKILQGNTKNPGLLTIEQIVAAIGCTMTDYYNLKEDFDNGEPADEEATEASRS